MSEVVKIRVAQLAVGKFMALAIETESVLFIKQANYLTSDIQNVCLEFHQLFSCRLTVS